MGVGGEIQTWMGQESETEGWRKAGGGGIMDLPPPAWTCTLGASGPLAAGLVHLD